MFTCDRDPELALRGRTVLVRDADIKAFGLEQLILVQMLELVFGNGQRIGVAAVRAQFQNAVLASIF